MSDALCFSLKHIAAIRAALTSTEEAEFISVRFCDILEPPPPEEEETPEEIAARIKKHAME